MQVKKFEAPTIQEALDTIKRELGPEAIILHTKKNRKGFGLMSRGSVEVTAAVSERALQKKGFTDTRLPDGGRKEIQDLPAGRQAEIYDRYLDRHLRNKTGSAEDQVQISTQASAPAARTSGARSSSVQASGTRASGTQASGLQARTAAPRQGSGAVTAGKPITVTRYADIDDDEVRASLQTRLAKATLDAHASGAADPGITLHDEVRHLKRIIEELKESQDEMASVGGAVNGARPGTLGSPATQDAYEQLTLGGVDKRFALGLVRKAAFELGEGATGTSEEILDQVASELMLGTEVLSPLNGLEPRAKTGSIDGPMIIALVGPTGVGKTTTIAKMASEALLRRSLKVGLINLDSYKIAAFDQLATYAKILNVPFRSASSSEDVSSAIADFKGLDLVIIDTTGRSQRDPAALKEMESILSKIEGLNSHLVLSATTRDGELYDMAQRFSMFHPRGLIFSKLDEATTFGAIYNVSRKAQLPLSYFTTGQRVPEDIEEASKERTAALILGL